MQWSFYLTVCSNFVFCCGAERFWVTTDELENHISPEDLREFFKTKDISSTTETNDVYAVASEKVKTLGPVRRDDVDCFGLRTFSRQMPWLFSLEPDSSDKINTHYYFSSRIKPTRVQVFPGNKNGYSGIDYNAKRRTVVIIHGFMSYSNATWILNMTRAFLNKFDVNVITVDWSGGGNTWKYWKAAANTRRVGSDVIRFLQELVRITDANIKNFHLVGHSLGAHICSYVSYHLGGVSRISGLDPAQPCFRIIDGTERLDKSDADFVDVIHTNGRLLSNIGFGLPELLGHADFYPNGGLIQPGCFNCSKSMWSLVPMSNMLEQAICSHGRAYLLFTESLMSNCSFRAYKWNLTYEGVNSSLQAGCDRAGSCASMGIDADGENGSLRAAGSYFVFTNEKDPYCPTDAERRHPHPELLRDLREGYEFNRTSRKIHYMSIQQVDTEVTTPTTDVTTKTWFWRIFG